MKLVPPDQRRAISAVRLAFSLVLMVTVPLLLYAAPAWWSQHNVVVQNIVPDDYAPANQGQVKNIAQAAIAEMDAKLTGGAGDELHHLLNSWSTTSTPANDFAPVNLGQLKKIAQPFYDRLIALGTVDHYPWLSSAYPFDDFAVANIGQVKNLFSFEIRTSNLVSDPSADRVAVSEHRVNLALEDNAIWSWNSSNAAWKADFEQNLPHRVPGLSGIRSITAGDRHLVALTLDGTVLTWGDNDAGQLGDGTFTPIEAPALVPNLTNIISVKAGDAYTLALQQDGTILAWGDNYYGQFGTGDTISSNVPRLVAGLARVSKIAAGYAHSAALTKDGTVWTWGHDHAVELDINNPSPTKVPNFFDVVDIAAGYEHTVAVKADGTVWAWGANYSNQLGNGTTSGYVGTPVQVANLRNIVKVASRYDHSLALASDGTVWAWGYNRAGQLGDGTTDVRRTPVRVSGLTDVVSIATSWEYSLAMKADGTVWTWGTGATGILRGLDVLVPQQVGLGLLDTDHNGMDDRWELQFLGNRDQSPDADFDGDGVTNRQEFLRRTNPTDYFNGVTPVIEVTGGNNQNGNAGTFLSKPLKVTVRSQTGQILANAPVMFTLPDGLGGLATTLNGELQQSLEMRTDSNGQATAYRALPDAPGTSTQTLVRAGFGGAWTSAAFRSVVRLSRPSPTPSGTPPDPNSSPTPTPTATPVAPYRYAIIDLGRDLYPTRVNNRGQVLMKGYNSDHEEQWFRWTGGALEHLTYSDPHTEMLVEDMNDSGIVVGSMRNQIPWKYNDENELQAGLIWYGSEATTLSAPDHYQSFQPFPGTILSAALTAINNADVMYGYSCTGTVLGFLNSTITVTNAQSWPGPVQLTDLKGTPFPEYPFASTWEGKTYSILRANSSGHYIGSKFTPLAFSFGFLLGDYSPMIDGESISFHPVEINEAGIVIGWSDAGMIVSPPSAPQITINGASPLAINDHTRPAPSSGAEFPLAPKAIAAPQILASVSGGYAILERQADGTWHPFGLEEMLPSMDDWQGLSPTDINDDGFIVGSGWYSDPSNPNAPAQTHAFMLVPAEMVPDFNRDGKIDDDDRGRVTESEPWRWWINDDDDSGDTGGDDIPQNTGHPNFRTIASPDGIDTGTIDGTRDLIDFFPVYLDVRELVRMFPPDGPTGFTYNLKQEGGSTNFVYTDLKSSEALDYLRKLTGAETNNALALGGAPGMNGATTHHVTSEGVRLDPQWLRRISSASYGVLLVEGRKEDTHPLILEICGSSGHRFAQVRLPLSLSSVEQMYRHKNLMGADNASGGRPDYATGNDTVHDEPENYPDDLCNNKDFVFVHGYNVNPNDARGWNSEMFKRFYHSGSKARFIGVTWHGAETQVLGSITTDYQANVDNAFASSHEFANFLSTLANVTVAAHSLGNVLVGSAIQDWQAHPSTYLMIDCAIAQESYDDTEERLTKGDVLGMEHPEWLSYDRRLWSSDWHDRFPANDNRSKLTWKSRLENVDQLRTYNFYSTGEEVLRNPKTAPTLPLSANEVWNKQERMKGRMLTGQILSSNYGGWAFSLTWDVTEARGSRQRTPSETVEIPSDELKSNPFFKSGPADLYGANGSDYAAPQQHRNTLLAEMIPALSFATGSNPLTLLAPPGGENRNHNMMEYKTVWPRTNPDWQHSDVKVVAYSYLYRLFGKLVESGALNE